MPSGRLLRCCAGWHGGDFQRRALQVRIHFIHRTRPFSFFPFSPFTSKEHQSGESRCRRRKLKSFSCPGSCAPRRAVTHSRSHRALSSHDLRGLVAHVSVQRRVPPSPSLPPPGSGQAPAWTPKLFTSQTFEIKKKKFCHISEITTEATVKRQSLTRPLLFGTSHQPDPGLEEISNCKIPSDPQIYVPGF